MCGLKEANSSMFTGTQSTAWLVEESASYLVALEVLVVRNHPFLNFVGIKAMANTGIGNS
ncbi:MAG TPA: hypothetical protein DDW33_14500 [Ktedonobacter sp.]|nr:hypothetical protein [Ktedonobacter sp.]